MKRAVPVVLRQMLLSLLSAEARKRGVSAYMKHAPIQNEPNNHSAQFVVLNDYDAVLPHLSAVRKNADAHKKELGFLSHTAYSDKAKKGKLWVLSDPDKSSYIGHLLFGGRDDTLNVVQLFIAPVDRGKGFARELLNCLKEYGERLGKLSIIARVATDLPANKFYEREGFRLVCQKTGGKTTGRTINIRAYRLSTPTLFGGDLASECPAAMLNRPAYVAETYVLDMNALFDLLRERAPVDGVRNLVEAACKGRIKLMRTAEMVKELERTSNGKEDSLLTFAEKLPALPSREEKALSLLVSALRPIVFPDRDKDGKSAQRDESDLRHLAHCIASNVGTFVTGEKAILRVVDELYSRYQLDIRSPSEFEENDKSTNAEFTAIGDDVANIRFANAGTGDSERVSFFLKALGVDKGKTEQIIDFDAPARRREGILGFSGAKLCGVLLYESGTMISCKEEVHIYVDETMPGYRTIVEYLLCQACLRTPGARISLMELFIRPDQSHTRMLAISRGFRPVEQTDQDFRLAKPACRHVLTSKSWNTSVREFQQCASWNLPDKMPTHVELQNTGIVLKENADVSHTFSLFDFETMISPGFLLPAGREGVIIPIQQDFAEDLLNAVNGQMRLDLYKTGSIRTFIERAYFRKPRAASKISQGMPLFFYVSAFKGKAGGIRVAARCTCSKVVSVEQALVEFSRQGVLDESMLRKQTNGQGMVHVFTFDSVRLLSKEISFRKLREENIADRSNFVTLQTVNTEQMTKLISLGGESHG